MYGVRCKQPVAVEDCYGELFAYLQDTFCAFLPRVGQVSVDFEMHCMDFKELPQYLGKDKNPRIEVRMEAQCLFDDLY